jgi:four helix bundle protein
VKLGELMSYQSYADWEQSVSPFIKGDLLWKMEAYRLALFLGDIAWHDVTKLYKDPRMLDLSNQLYRAVGSISANIAEGYSRSSGRDRVRFYEYALGSACESRNWYHKGRHILDSTVTNHRLDFCTQVIRLLLTVIPDQRDVKIQEDRVPYSIIPLALFNDIP